MAFKAKNGNLLSQLQIGITQCNAPATYVSDCNEATSPNVEFYTNLQTQNKPLSNVSTWQVWCHLVNQNSIVQFATQKSTNSALYMRQYNGTWGDWVIVTRPLDVYPVGSVYQSSESTNPAQYFGGTWTQVASVETCTIVGRKVVAPQSLVHASLFTLEEVRTMLHDAFGIDTADITDENVFVDCADNYWGISNHAVLTVFYDQASTTYFAYFSGTSASNQDVRYIITYNKEMYKFVRTA